MDSDESIVITGISGKLPESENIQEFTDLLLSGEDLVTENDRRFKAGFQGVPKRCGTIPTVDKFDNEFFGIQDREANLIDVRHRMLLESVYECIVDAGVNPKELSGTKTGVYVALSYFDPLYTNENIEGRSTGILASFAANRISYTFNLKGPSYIIDTACSSSFYALVCAFKDMLHGDIENAIVCGTNINFSVAETAEYNRVHMLSPDGTCKTFSSQRNGYVRSEALVSTFLQRAKHARRIYATVLGGKLNCDGFKKEGASFPSAEAQFELMNGLYTKYNIHVDDICYFEAHGTGTSVGDNSECSAIEKIFRNKREPLLIGSVKSNMGHSEIAAGMCSLVKIITAINTGVIPANLHYQPFDLTLAGLKDGLFKVVTENTPLKDGLIAINCFGFGGANGHVVLKPHTKIKEMYERSTFRIVFASGRTPEAVDYILDGALKNQDDQEFLALLDEIHKHNIEGHHYRGYTILGSNYVRKIDKFPASRPIWFIYPGIGSQWKTMGLKLLNISTFKKTFDRCSAVLKPLGIDLYYLVTSDDKKVLEDITSAVVAINAIQIALTDVLQSLGIVPDGYAGQCFGEVGCAYADGSISIEEAVLLNYARVYGFHEKKTSTIQGLSAVIGLSEEDVRHILPNDVHVAGINAKKSIIVSGPKESVRNLVDNLTAKGIFTEIINDCGVPLHTTYTEVQATHAKKYLEMLLKNPKVRSSKWISTCIPDNNEPPEWGKLSSSQYHYNNLQNPSLFHQVFNYIPKNAIVVEIAPNGILRNLLRRELGSNTCYISLSSQDSKDNELHFWSAIGEIYIAGGLPELRKLYPDVKLPVGRGTQMISPLVKWNHSSSLFTPTIKQRHCFSGKVIVSFSNTEYSHLRCNEINGKILMPGMGYVLMVWKVLANEFFLKDYCDVPIIIENISFRRITTIPPDDSIEFVINIVRKSGEFEIYESGSLVSSGIIRGKDDDPSKFEYLQNFSDIEYPSLTLKKNDFYKHFQLKGQLFGEPLKGMLECDLDGSRAKIEWTGNMDCFLENILQLGTFLIPNSKEIILSTNIEKIIIDPVVFLKAAHSKKEMHVAHDSILNITRCRGLYIAGIEFVEIPRKKTKASPWLEIQKLTYYKDDSRKYTFETAVDIAVQIVLQNCRGIIRRPRVCCVASDNAEDETFSVLLTHLRRQPLADADHCKMAPDQLEDTFDLVVIMHSTLAKLNDVKIEEHLTDSGFILFIGSQVDRFKAEIVFEAKTDTDNVYLLRPPKEIPANYGVVKVENTNFQWIENVKNYLKEDVRDIVYLYSDEGELSGMVGLINCLLKESSNVRGIVVDNTQKFDVNSDFIKNQLKKGLVINFLKDGRWGTFLHFPFQHEPLEEVQDAAVEIQTLGDFKSLSWIKLPARPKQKKLVNVFYSGVNLIDVIYASGKQLNPFRDYEPTDTDLNIGHEYSGTCGGKRVMGLLKNAGISLQVEPMPDYVWDVPTNWTLQDAATVPFAYVMSYYALILKGQLKANGSILILSTSNSMNLACISIALNLGCNVFAGVTDEEKRNALKSIFPELNEQHIGLPNDKLFLKRIMQNTGGKGVDVIFSCAVGELFASVYSIMSCMRNNGHYIEMETNEMFRKLPLNSNTFSKNCSFHRILFEQILTAPAAVKQQINDFMKKGLQTGSIKPLPRTVFPETEIENAFRAVESKQSLGNILIEIREETPKTLRSPVRSILANRKLYFHPHKCYILVGGTGGLGLQLCDWIIRRGARKIVLNSRSGIAPGYQTLCLHKWSQFKGVTVRISTANSITLSGAEQLILKAAELGPVGGIFNLSLVLKDNLLEHQTIEDFEIVFNSKLTSPVNLDILSRKMCPELDHFVGFSSLTVGRGNGGQTNYGMANSALERMCEKRRRDKLPALIIQLGPIGDAGAAESTQISSLFKQYLGLQPMPSCLATLEEFMLQTSTVGSSGMVVEKDQVDSSKAKTAAEVVALILGIKDIEKVDKSLSMVQLGLDSLMAAEVKQTLYRLFKMDLDIEKIRDLTLIELTDVK